MTAMILFQVNRFISSILNKTNIQDIRAPREAEVDKKTEIRFLLSCKIKMKNLEFNSPPPKIVRILLCMVN
jgi:hypothetical protein